MSIYKFTGTWRELTEGDGVLYWHTTRNENHVKSFICEIKRARVCVSIYKDRCYSDLSSIDEDKDYRCFWSTQYNYRDRLLTFEEAKELAEKALIGAELFGIDVVGKYISPTLDKG
jgi:hypothetical protein